MLRALLIVTVIALSGCADPREAKIQRSANASDIRIEAPNPDERIASPLRASGAADNSWFFEASFPARLMARDGTLIAEAPAIAASDWTRDGPVPFNVEMAFTVDEETPATLVLEKDMPRDNEDARQVRIPVVLTPGPS